MILSVQLRYMPYHCEVCLVENGHVLEYFGGEKMADILVYLMQITARFPALLLVLVSDLETDLCSLSDLLKPGEQHNKLEQNNSLQEFLQAMNVLPVKSIHLPAVKYAPGVPLYRKRFFPTMGSPRTLCTLATLLYRMRQQNATWTEMTFFYLELQSMSYTLVVVKDGTIVDGGIYDFRSQPGLSDVEAQEQAVQLLELAFWERLTRDLAGLTAIHHIEDIVLYAGGKDVDNMGVESNTNVKPAPMEGAIERFGDSYRLYQFPQDESEQAGHEIAFGAALLAEGLLDSSHAIELAQRLLSVLLLPL